MRATAASEGSSSVTWALWKARTGSSTRRACTTTRRSPSIAPSAIVATKAGCSRSWPTCSHDRVGTKKRVPCWRKPKRICAPSAKARSGGAAVPARTARARRRRAGARPAIARGGEHRCRSAWISTRARSCGRRSRRCARRSTRPGLLLDDVGPGRRREAEGLGRRSRRWPANASKRSSDFWPKLSTISSAARSLPLKPTRTDWNAPSFALGLASAHSRPSFAGRLASSKSLSSEPPASSAAGVAPSAWPMRRELAWFRSRS